jgi:hypothetical protein
MQAKGSGKHDILPVARATVTTPECMWMTPRDPVRTCAPAPKCCR